MDPEKSEQLKKHVLEVTFRTDVIFTHTPVHGEREQIELDGRTIPAVFYPAEKENAPVIFAFHGGGFAFGHCALDDRLHDMVPFPTFTPTCRKCPKFKWWPSGEPPGQQRCE